MDSNKLKKGLLIAIAFLLGIGLVVVLWIFVIDPILSKTDVGQLTSTTIDTADYQPFFPDLYSTEIGTAFSYESIIAAYDNETTDELTGDFQFYYFQPIVKEYIEKDGLHIMIAEYADPETPDVRRNVQILLGGDVNVPERIADDEALSAQYNSRFSDGVVYLTTDNIEVEDGEEFHTQLLPGTFSSEYIISIDSFKQKVPVGTQIALMYMGGHTPTSELTDEICTGFEIECAVSEQLFDYGFGEIGTFHQGGQVSADFYLLPYFFTPELINE